MKLSTALALSALLALSSTMPLEKRQDITITTTIDILEIETVDVVVTVWLPPGGKPVDQNQNQQVAQPSTPNPAPVVHVTPVENAVVPAQTAPPVAQQNPPEAAQSQADQAQDQANQAQEKTNQAQAAKNQAAQEQSIQTQNQANQAQEQANDSKVAQNQAASAPNPPSPAVAVNTPAAAPVESPAVPPATQDSTSYDDTQQTSGGSCGQIGGSCTATNVTYFGGGMGACGWSNDTNSEDFFALAHNMMGTQSNGNPFCGRTAAIVYQGKTIHGTLTDKCMGCGLQSIDLSQHLYDQLFVESEGNYHEVEWHFTS